MKLKPRNKRRKALTLDEQMKLAGDYNAGLSLKEIEKKYDVTTTTIYRIINQLIN